MKNVFIASALVLFALASCGKESAGSGGDGTGNIILTVSGEPVVTVSRADGRTAKEGNVMNTLSLWLVKNDEILIHKHLITPGNDPDKVEVVFSKDGRSASMKFTDIPRGDCTLYVVANYDDLDDGVYKEGAKIDDGFRNMLLSKTEIPDGDSPEFGDEGMPCSAVVNLSVSAGNNYVSARLLRCVGRLTISVRNNIANSSLFFRSVGLSRQNPSLAYIFEHDNRIPPESRNIFFPDLTEIQRVDALTDEPVTIYDTYLYETAPEEEAEPFTFSLFGAVYRDSYKTEDVVIDYRQEYTFEPDMSGSLNSNDLFLLRSAASENYYLGDDGGLTYRFFSGDTELTYHRGIENYFWHFSGTGPATLTNVGTGRQIRLEGETTEMVSGGNGSTFTVNRDRSLSGIRLSNGGYSLAIDPDRNIYGANDRDGSLVTHWLYRRVKLGNAGSVPYFKDAEYEIPLVPRTLTYIDAYGVPQDLRRIYRNEHVKLTIGVFYNRELGQLDFQVEPWRRKDSETTFD